MPGSFSSYTSRTSGIAYILVGIGLIIFSFYNPEPNLYLLIVSIFPLALGIYAIIHPFKEPSTQIPQTTQPGGGFQLRPGEEILRKEVVLYEALGYGVLYLTNQRLFVEYFKFMTFTRSIEIPLTEITNVEKTWQTSRGRGNALLYGPRVYAYIKVEYRHIGEPGTIIFLCGSNVQAAVLRVDEWVAQIQKAANLPAKKEAGQGG